MKRWFAALAAIVLVAAACGDSGDDGGEATPTTATPATAAPTTAAPTTVAATPETAATEPDMSDEPATATGTPADLAITEVVFGDRVTITNLGDGAVSVDGLWLCNRPSYLALPTALIAPGESLEIPASDLPLSSGGGEVALYNSSDFGDSSAILDYVAWGTGGGRASVAADAGIWPAGETVAPAEGSISAPNGGASASDWS